MSTKSLLVVVTYNIYSRVRASTSVPEYPYAGSQSESFAGANDSPKRIVTSQHNPLWVDQSLPIELQDCVYCDRSTLKAASESLRDDISAALCESNFTFVRISDYYLVVRQTGIASIVCVLEMQMPEFSETMGGLLRGSDLVAIDRATSVRTWFVNPTLNMLFAGCLGALKMPDARGDRFPKWPDIGTQCPVTYSLSAPRRSFVSLGRKLRFDEAERLHGSDGMLVSLDGKLVDGVGSDGLLWNMDCAGYHEISSFVNKVAMLDAHLLGRKCIHDCISVLVSQLEREKASLSLSKAEAQVLRHFVAEADSARDACVASDVFYSSSIRHFSRWFFNQPERISEDRSFDKTLIKLRLVADLADAKYEKDREETRLRQENQIQRMLSILACVAVLSAFVDLLVFLGGASWGSEFGIVRWLVALLLLALVMWCAGFMWKRAERKS